MVRRLPAAAAALAACALPAQAIGACWTPAAADAAQLRGLETMLMVSALRCRLDGVDFLSDYNRFIRINRPTLTEANDRLRAHFDNGDGWRESMDRYDGYVTAIANRHGDEGAYGCRELALITQDAIDARGDPDVLLRLSHAVGVDLPAAGGLCRAGRWAARQAPVSPARGGWAARQGTAAVAAAPVEVAPLAPAALVPAVAAVAPAGSAAAGDPALPVTRVVDAPVAEPQPVPTMAAAGAAPAIVPAAQVATAAPAIVPAVTPAVATSEAQVTPAAGGAAVTGTGDLEIEVSEGPAVNGVRTKTYRIRLAN